MARRADDYGKRGVQTRKRILDAAFRLIGHERGLSVRIEEVCVAASISRAAFYHYFTGMEELFAALSVEISHEFNMAVFSTVRHMTSAVERTDAGTRYYLDKAASDPAWGWAMVHISANGPLFGAEAAMAALGTIGQGIAAGEMTIPGAELGRDLQQGTVLATMLSQLKRGGLESHGAAVSLHILLGLGVSAEVARDVVSRPLPAPSFDPTVLCDTG